MRYEVEFSQIHRRNFEVNSESTANDVISSSTLDSPMMSLALEVKYQPVVMIHEKKKKRRSCTIGSLIEFYNDIILTCVIFLCLNGEDKLSFVLP